jgi:hypothetical protein
LCHVHPRIVARSSSKETNAIGKNLPPNKKWKNWYARYRKEKLWECTSKEKEVGEFYEAPEVK